jgi:hypothetical protein
MPDDDLEKFQVVCPACSNVFDLDESVIKKGFDDGLAVEYLEVTCPECDCQRCPTIEDC